MPVCLFDIDGTLLSSGGAGQAAMEVALAEVFGVTRPTEGVPVAGRTDRAITTEMLAFHEIAPTPENWSRFQDAYFRRLPVELGCRPGLVLPGAAVIVERLAKETGLIVGLLTGNFRRGAELKLEHFGLMRHFCCGGFGDDHHSRDDVARSALARVRAHHPSDDLRDVWVIGDTPADIQCGRAIGATVVAVATGHYSADELAAHDPDHLFEDFSDTELVIELLSGAAEAD